MGEVRNAHNILGKYEEKRPPERPRCMWEDNIRMDLRVKGWEGVEWLHVTQDRDEWWACEHGNEPSGSIKSGYFLASKVTISFSRRTLPYGVSKQVGWLVGWLVGFR
jgi:hypothetical protein